MKLIFYEKTSNVEDTLKESENFLNENRII